MYLLATFFTLIEIAVFLTALAAFLLTLRFFLSNQKNLHGLLAEPRRKSPLNVELDRDGFLVPTAQKFLRKPKAIEPDTQTQNELRELRSLIQQQQTELSKAVRQIELLANDRYDEKEEWPEPKTTAPTPEFEELKAVIARKESELTELRQQTELSQKLQGHFEEVQSGYEELQAKVHQMEQQAWRTADVAIKMDSLEQSNAQLEKNLVKKEDRLRELTLENGRLHEAMNEVEDKLSEANLQRQQLLKKVQFLEEVNAEVQQISDANRKLRTELRRVAELESMLNLITEERDALLSRRQ